MIKKKWALFLIQVILAIIIWVEMSAVSFKWNPVTVDFSGNPVIVDYYEFKFVRDGTGEEFGPYQTTATSITIPKPKSGVYVIWGRTVANYPNGNPANSAWMNSLMPEYNRAEDGVKEIQWKVRFKPAMPSGPLVIE